MRQIGRRRLNMGLWREYTEPFNSKTQRRRLKTGQKPNEKKNNW
jgi:hypothetical protein